MPQLSLLDYRPPAQRHSPTSVAAAESIRSAIGPLHAQILDFLADHGPATDEEMQLGIPMAPNTQRPRRIELVASGYMADTGTVRANRSGRKAAVWKAA